MHSSLRCRISRVIAVWFSICAPLPPCIAPASAAPEKPAAVLVDASRPGVDRASAGPHDAAKLVIPITIVFTKAMDAGELPKLSIDRGALDGTTWVDTVTLTCTYDPESKGAVDTVRIAVKGGRDRGAAAQKGRKRHDRGGRTV